MAAMVPGPGSISIALAGLIALVYQRRRRG
jgi:uncharacterized protein (TIGR03382 family)